MNEPSHTKKSAHAEREEKVLEYWKKERIFEKTLEKNRPLGREFVFYEGPPTANGHPHIGHFEGRAFKDAIPRYKTMRGFYVRRKGGWDTHGLPVELQVEKELGLKSKKEIETYGIEAFNEKCKLSVWKYVHEWEEFTKRMGYWVDLTNPYVTYRPSYMESLWNVVKHVDDKKLLYKDYKVVPWCPRCGTALSSHELAQGYETVKDLSVTVKFKVKSGQKIGDFVADDKTYILAWTTTPWTLPGNVGLAVGDKLSYAIVKAGEEHLIVAKNRMIVVNVPHTVEKSIHGHDLLGLEYEPLYPFLGQTISGPEKDKMKNAYKVYAANFVTTEDGTGVVHTAVMYGQDDFELGTKVGLPKFHLVNDDGTFKKEVGFLAGKFVRDEEVAVEIIKDLAHRGLLFSKEKHEHTYPFCWRCKTPLIYFARNSWYIRMSELRNKLVAENAHIHWEPEHIKEGRFGEWLREVKDWAISRERYWGTPLPVWNCEKCHKRKVAGSVADIARKPNNTYYVMRHGEAENNVLGILSGIPEHPHHLTEKGKQQAAQAAERLRGIKIDMVYVSPFVRTQETLAIVKEKLGWKDVEIKTDSRIRELISGNWNGKNVADYVKYFSNKDRFGERTDGVENFADMKMRMGDFLYDVDKNHSGKTILIVTHESPAHMLVSAAQGLNRRHTIALRRHETKEFISNAEVKKLDFEILPHNREYELDLHRPFIDEVVFPCSCGGEMKRVKEVMDVWFDSGAMPFAQDHYPFGEDINSVDVHPRSFWDRLFPAKQKLSYPADFICEGIDQTRGWFYTLHAIGALMGKGRAYTNVVALGHVLDAQGKKMSKSLGNTVDPMSIMDKFGADPLRFWMYSVNQPGDSKNFDEKTVDEVVKKVFNLVSNVTSFYKMYENPKIEAADTSTHVLDRWILSRMHEVVKEVTTHLDNYKFMEPTRAIRDFIGDLSQWYLRRSRDRFKEESVDKNMALATTRCVLTTLAKIMAPFTPFFAEELYKNVGGLLESVHLENWPAPAKVDKDLIQNMEGTRALASRGLEARMKAGINVRQPLAKLIVPLWKPANAGEKAKARELPQECIELIKDEINVKAVVFNLAPEAQVELDTKITPELKEEGELRELTRKIQDLRKEKGFTVSDMAVLVATRDAEAIIKKHTDAIMKATKLSSIEFGEVFDLKR